MIELFNVHNPYDDTKHLLKLGCWGMWQNLFVIFLLISQERYASLLFHPCIYLIIDLRGRV